MRAVNLLPKEALGRERQGLPRALPLLGAAAVPVVALALVIVGYSGAHSAVTAKQGELTSLRAEVATLAPAVSPPVPDTAGLATERTQRLIALEDALGKKMPWDTTLGQVARVLPGNVWLTTLTMTSPTPADSSAVAATPSPTSFTLEGFAYTEDDVALLLARLQLLPSLSGVTLGSTGRTIVGAKALVQFQVTASIQPSLAGPQT